MLLRRLRALLGDVVLVLPWVAFAGAVGLGLRVVDAAPTTPVGRDALAFVTLVGPTTVTAAWLESGPRRATPGKRWAGLQVVGLDGGTLPRHTALLRSVVRFLPWQLAHTAVFHLVDGSTSPAWFAVSVAAQATVLLSWVLVARDGRALHDRVTGARVVPAATPGAGARGASASGVGGCTA